MPFFVVQIRVFRKAVTSRKRLDVSFTRLEEEWKEHAERWKKWRSSPHVFMVSSEPSWTDGSATKFHNQLFLGQDDFFLVVIVASGSTLKQFVGIDRCDSHTLRRRLLLAVEHVFRRCDRFLNESTSCNKSIYTLLLKMVNIPCQINCLFHRVDKTRQSEQYFQFLTFIASHFESNKRGLKWRMLQQPIETSLYTAVDTIETCMRSMHSSLITPMC